MTNIEAEIQAVDQRVVLLAQLRGVDDERPGASTDSSEARLLTGPAIRMTAVAVVRDSPEGQGPLHYRRWLELVEAAGFEVGGQKPSATFLSQISRSPVVRRTTHAGQYEIDREAPARLRRRVVSLRSQLTSKHLEQTDPVDLDDVRQKRNDLVRTIEKVERELAEATATLTLSVGRLAEAG